MTKAILLAGAAALLSGTALAADLPRRAPPPVPVPVPVFTWTGAYLGFNAGYAVSENDAIFTRGIITAVNLENNVINGLRSRFVPQQAEGFTGGGQVGYNYQLKPGGGLVIGVEADAQYTDLRANRVETIFNPAFNPNILTNSYRTQLDYLGTVRGRVGVAFDRLLVYGTGGFAYGDVTRRITFQTGVPVTYAGRRSTIETGYAYGAGIEYALPTDSFLNFFKSNAVTVKAEYLRYELEPRTLLVASTGGPGVGYLSRASVEGSIGRAGINYKFGTY